jgi:hypothetical protein
MIGMEFLDLMGVYAGVLVTTAVGSGVGAYLLSYLKKKGENLATREDIDKLVQQVSAVTAATKQIEARITQASRVHERQLDILQRLYRRLYDAHDLLRRMTSTGRRAGDLTPEQYAPQVTTAVGAAFEEFLDGRLFISPALVRQCEEFFNAVFEGQLAADLAREPALHSSQRAHFWTSAAEVAHQQVPKILQQIYDAARAVIHVQA